MALFFDQEWFDRQLAALGKSRADLAARLGVSDAEIIDIWKDQREISPTEVAIIAEFLDQSRAEIASRCGVSTPSTTPLTAQHAQQGSTTKISPADGDTVLSNRLARIEGRLARLEQTLADIHAALVSRNSGQD